MWSRRVRLAGVDYLLCDKRGRPPANSRPLSRREFERLLARHGDVPQLRGLLCDLRGPRRERGRSSTTSSLRARTGDLTGTWACYELRRPIPRLAPIILEPYEPPSYEPSEPTPMFDEQSHWVEILLVDEDDAGIPGVDCEVTLATGQVITRRTNRHGVVRIEGVMSAANCTVCFPTLDEQAWSPA